MKRFAWRLQRVLDIKQKEEQIKRMELLEITEKLAQAKGELLMQKMILKNTINDLRKENPKDRLGKQAVFLRCSKTNDEIINNLKNKTGQLKSEQKEKIADVLKVRRFKEGLEKLRVDAKMQFMRDQEKLEQKAADEITTVRFSRKIMQHNTIGNSVN